MGKAAKEVQRSGTRGPSKEKKEEPLPVPVPPPAVTPLPGPRQMWTFGVNELYEDVAEQVVKTCKPTGNFRADFTALCEMVGVVPHPGLATPLRGEDVSDASSLVVQAVLVDLASMRVARCVLHTASQLRLVRFSSCSLDVDMMGLLRDGLNHADSTVATLQIDWNPVEVPVDPEALKELQGNNVWMERLDELERKREQQQAERTLHSFAERLRAKLGGDLETALREVAAHAEPEYTVTAMLNPLDIGSWMQALHAKLGLSNEESQQVFRMLDRPECGAGDGLVSFARCQEVIAAIPERSAEEELKDPIAAAFAGFMDGTSLLEALSFRYCNLGRIEAQAMGRALATCQHLRALNLWGNHICDKGAAALGQAFEQNFGLQYLGLGRNLVTHVGVESICKVLGVRRIDAKDQADPLLKSINHQNKDRDKKLSKHPPVLKFDANGRERYTSEPYHVDSCEERKDPTTGQVFWVWTRNTTLKTLVLERNPISDAEAIQRLQPFGVGDLVLRNTPCAEVLLRVKAEQEARLQEQARERANNASAETEGVEPLEAAQPELVLTLSPTGGWNLVLR